MLFRSIVDAIEAMHGELLITADHGNVEQMLDADSGQPLTSHTNGPVPLVYVGDSGRQFLSEGCLSDIAPTLLSLLDMPIPTEMTGKILMGDARSEEHTSELQSRTNLVCRLLLEKKKTKKKKEKKKKKTIT